MSDNLLNPKIAIMHMSLLAQFIQPGRGSVLGQSRPPGSVRIAISASINALIALGAGGVALFLIRHPGRTRMQRRLMGTVLWPGWRSISSWKGSDPMPMPYTYRHASEEFRAYLKDLRKRTLIDSDNVLYTGTDAVLTGFRARLTVAQALRFADELPSVLRAIFVWRWNPEAPGLPWPDRETLRDEMVSLRRDHNFCPPELLEEILMAVPRTMRPPDFARALAMIGPEAEAFWEVPAPEPRPG